MEPRRLPDYARAVIQLYKGVLYREQEALWKLLLDNLEPVRKHFNLVGADVYLDEAEGFAFLKEWERWDEEQRAEFPKFIEKRRLTYPDSLLCVLLRQELLKHAATTSERMLRMSRQDITTQALTYLQLSEHDETRALRKVEESINRLEDFGFLRRLDVDEDAYEVRRILNAFVDVAFLDETLAKLQAHATHYFADAKSQPAASASE